MTVLFPPTSAASIPSASETVEGKARVATSAEVTTGTDNTTIVTPLTLTQKINASLSGGVEYKGSFNPSSPGTTLDNAQKGDLYIIGSGVTNVEYPASSGVFWNTGDHLIINTDMGGTVDTARIDKIDSTDSVTSVAGKTGPVTLVVADLTDNADLARLVSPTFTGVPEAPTAATSTNTTQLATTAFVQQELGSISAGNLGGLSDVFITSVSNNDLLKYNSSTQNWVNTTISSSEVTGLGSAATKDVGTTAGDVLVFSVNAQLPALDGSQLTNLDGSQITNLPSATTTTQGVVELANSTETLNQTGTDKVITSSLTQFIPLGGLHGVSLGTPSAGDVLTFSGTSWNSSAPAGGAISGLADVTLTSLADGEFLKYNSSNTAWENVSIASTDLSDSVQLARLASPNFTGTPTTWTPTTSNDSTQIANTFYVNNRLDTYGGGTGLSITGSAGTTVLNVDVGTTANKIVQLDGTGKLPALDGSQLTNLPSANLSSSSIDDLSDVDTTTNAPTSDQLLSWDGTNWVPATTEISLDTSPELGGDLITGTRRIRGNLTVQPPVGTNTYGTVNVYTNISSIGGTLRLYSGSSNGGSTQGNFVALMAPASISSSFALSLPTSAGSSGQLLTTNGSSALSWTGPYLLESNNLSEIATAGAAAVTAAQQNLDLEPGVDIQEFDSGLNSIAGLTTSANQMLYTTASDVYATTSITQAGRDILDDADSAAQRTTLGLGSAATKDAGTLNGNVLLLSADNTLPALDGSNLTNIPAAADINDITNVSITSAASGDVLKYDGTNWVDSTLASTELSDSAQLARLASPNFTGTPTAPTALPASNHSSQIANTYYVNNRLGAYGGGTGLSITGSGGSTVLNVDVGTTANKIVRLDGSAKLPSVDGSQLTNIPIDITLDTAPVLGGDLDVGTYDILSTSNRDIDLAPNGTGSVTFKGSGSGGNGAGRFVLNCEQNSHGITIQGPPHSANATYTLTLPSALGSANQFLKTDASGNTSWDGPLLAVSENLSEIATAGASAVTAAQQNLDLEPGVDIQAYDAGLQSIAGLSTSANQMLYTTNTDVYATTSITQAGRDILDDADASAQRTTLGLGSAATKDAGTLNGNVLLLSADNTLPALDGSNLTNIPAAADINDITNVTITSVASGQYIKYNGTSWVNVAIASADLPAATTAIAGVNELSSAGEVIAGSGNGSIIASQIQYIKTSLIDNDAGFITALSDDSTPSLGGDLIVGSGGNSYNFVNNTANSGFVFKPNGAGYIEVYSKSSANGGGIKLWEANSSGTNPSTDQYVLLQAPNSITSNYAFKFPDGMGTSGQVLTTDGTSSTSWTGPHLLASNNLSDLDNAATARNELGLGTAAVEDAGTSANELLKLDSSGLVPLANLSSATFAAEGIVELASTTEIAAATDQNKVMTPYTTKFIPLNNLQNVTLGTLVEGDVLTYDLGTNKWVNRQPAVVAITTQTGSFTAAVDKYYRMNPSASITVTLPDASTVDNGDEIEFKLVAAQTVTINVASASGDLIDGASSYTMDVQWSALRLKSDGSGVWDVL